MTMQRLIPMAALRQSPPVPFNPTYVHRSLGERLRDAGVAQAEATRIDTRVRAFAGPASMAAERLDVDAMVHALGADGAARLLMRTTNYEQLVDRQDLCEWMLSEDAPLWSRSELARALSAAADHLERSRESVLVGGWVRAAQTVHPWLRAQVGAALPRIGWTGTDEGDFSWPEDPRIRAAREELLDFTIEILGALSSSSAQSEKTAHRVVIALLSRLRTSADVDYLLGLEAALHGLPHSPRRLWLPTTSMLDRPGLRSRLALAALVDAELATRRMERARETLIGRTGEPVAGSYYGLVVRGRRKAVDAVLASYERSNREVKRITRQLAVAAQRLLLPRGRKRRPRKDLVDASAGECSYQYEGVTSWASVRFEVDEDGSSIGVLLGNVRARPLTPALLDMVDRHPDRRAVPTALWSTLHGLLLYAASHPGREVYPEDMLGSVDPKKDKNGLGAFKTRLVQVRKRLNAAFPHDRGPENPVPFTPGKGWAPAMVVCRRE